MNKNNRDNRKLKFIKKDKQGHYDIDGVSFDGEDVVVASGQNNSPGDEKNFSDERKNKDKKKDNDKKKTVGETSQYLDPASHEVGKNLFRHTTSEGYNPDHNKG